MLGGVVDCAGVEPCLNLNKLSRSVERGALLCSGKGVFIAEVLGLCEVS